MFIYSILLFLFGAALGSVGNALIDRLPKNESWFKGRSHCDKCKHVLNSADLIPVFSYIFLGGRCRYCHKSIPYRNLLVEIICGLGAIFLTNIFLIFWVTLIIAVMDIENKMVSEVMIGLWVVLVISYQLPVIYWSGMLVGVAIIGGIWAVTRGKAMGFGDVEIAAVMGLALGWQKVLLALWIAFVIGAIVGMFMIMKKRARIDTAVAFGPFLIMGYWIAYFWGDKIIRYYLGVYV